MYTVVKRVFDIIISLICIIILIPLSIVIKVLYIIYGDFNSIFYTQTRIGKNGKPFKMYKFRTMIIDSDKVLKELLKDPEIKSEYEDAYKIKNDPRITKAGKILRVTSIDEFPQFINVFLGNMSIVGPRPVIKKELKKYGNNKKSILSVKPGITGNWVIHGRSNLPYKERINYEVEYIKKKSFIFDIKIVFKTVIFVFKRKGVL